MTMYGWTMNYEAYRQDLEHMDAPVMPGQLPNVQNDLRGFHYAKEKGVRVIDLSDDEKSKFLSDGRTVQDVRKEMDRNRFQGSSAE